MSGFKAIRDWHYEYAGSSSITIDTIQQHGGLGVDFSIVNRGIDNIQVSIDNGDSIIVASGEALDLSDTLFRYLKIVASGEFNLIICGFKRIR